jgi:RNA polymerase sigma-70 factor (sigma-E family)
VTRWTDESFADYVAARTATMFRSALLLTGDREEAADVVQAVFERLWRGRGDVPDNPDAYTHRMLVNEWRDRLRARQRRARLTPWRHDAGRVDERLVQIVDRAQLLPALLALPPMQRAVVVLRVCDDAPTAEVARLLGCSEGTVKSHLSRGLERLRGALGAPEEEIAHD